MPRASTDQRRALVTQQRTMAAGVPQTPRIFDSPSMHMLHVSTAPAAPCLAVGPFVWTRLLLCNHANRRSATVPAAFFWLATVPSASWCIGQVGRGHEIKHESFAGSLGQRITVPICSGPQLQTHRTYVRQGQAKRCPTRISCKRRSAYSFLPLFEWKSKSSVDSWPAWRMIDRWPPGCRLTIDVTS